MKKLVSMIVIVIFLAISCQTPRKFSTSFFERRTNNPQEVVDSIVNANLLPALTKYRDWNRSMYFSSDSVVTTQYLGVTSLKDTTYIFSITEFAGDSISLIKFRKE